MRIVSYPFPSPLALAPMAGVTDLAFRTICREQGGAHLHRDGQRQGPVLSGQKDHPPAAAGGGRAPRRRPDLRQRPGLHGGGRPPSPTRCPGPTSSTSTWAARSPKVANSGDGSGLMRDPDKAVQGGWRRWSGGPAAPVTVKFRLGWDKGSINCVEFAQAMEEAGRGRRGRPRPHQGPDVRRHAPTGTGFGR